MGSLELVANLATRWHHLQFASRKFCHHMMPHPMFAHIPDICHGHTDGVRGEKNLSCGEISNFCTWNMWRKLKFLHMWIYFKFLHMTDAEKSEISIVVCTIYGILLHFTLFCCKKFCFFFNLRCFSKNRFVAIYALLCGENFSQN